ncbi:hypothetical protein IWW48_000524 [Coemansia sp. RSA 1200]|nr:hypothetical protein IWW48_000524 [Coemansia sp. RSA 1200]
MFRWTTTRQKHTFARLAHTRAATQFNGYRRIRSLSSYVRLSAKVSAALANNEPVVALESTIISHGMPYPQNVETAQAVEAIIAKEGATAATVALIDGKIHVGLEQEELIRLARNDKNNTTPVVKASRRDIALVLSQRMLGATTVSGTMVAAHMAGIRLFATGGIGGVHRGAECTMDVSADLTELGRTPVTVVCAGAKSILDLPKTLEYLETQGVSVIAYGESNNFPAFFSPHSKDGLTVPWSLQTPEQVAALVHTNEQIGLQSGHVVAVPIPSEHATNSAEIERAVDTAVREAHDRGIAGKAATPFLLRRVVELTGGTSLKANIALVKNNARVAAQIARAHAAIMSNRRLFHSTRRVASTSAASTNSLKARPLLVVGGAAIDLTSRIGGHLDSNALVSATSYPGTVEMSVGGVGQNIARAAHFLGAETYLVSAVGNDVYGSTIRASMEAAGMPTSFLQYPGSHARTAVYSAMHRQDGDLVAAVADMEINGMVSAQQMEEAFQRLNPCAVGVDGNISVLALSNAIALSRTHRACVVFEPTSVPKCSKVLSALSFIRRSGAIADIGGLVHIVTPNVLEISEMARVAVDVGLVESVPPDSTVAEIAKHHYTLDVELIRDALTLFPLFSTQVVKLGSKGVAVVSPMSGRCERPVVRHIPAMKPSLVISSNGAGDSLVGALLASLCREQTTALTLDGNVALGPEDLDHIVRSAQKASILSLESPDAVSHKLSPELLGSD